MPTRQLICTKCGAGLSESTTPALFFCKYCGAYHNPEGVICAINIDERMEVLQEQIDQATEDLDSELWRSLSYEFSILEARTQVHGDIDIPTDPDRFDEYISKTVKTNELITFDDEIIEAYHAVGECIQQMISPKAPLESAQRLLKSYQNYFRSLLYHPEYPHRIGPTEADRLALDTATSAVQQYVPFWGQDKVDEVIQKVFETKRSDTTQAHCPHCGQPIDITRLNDAHELTCKACAKPIKR